MDGKHSQSIKSDILREAIKAKWKPVIREAQDKITARRAALRQCVRQLNAALVQRDKELSQHDKLYVSKRITSNDS